MSHVTIYATVVYATIVWRFVQHWEGPGYEASPETALHFQNLSVYFSIMSHVTIYATVVYATIVCRFVGQATASVCSFVLPRR